MKIVQLIASFLILCGVTLSSQAGVYKWVDKDGKVHYGSSPYHQQSEEIEIKKSRPTQQHDAEKQRKRLGTQKKLLKKYHDEREKNKLKASKNQQKKLDAIKKCVNLKNAIARNEQLSHLTKVNEQGKKVVLSRSETRLATFQLKNKYKKMCNQ